MLPAVLWVQPTRAMKSTKRCRFGVQELLQMIYTENDPAIPASRGKHALFGGAQEDGFLIQFDSFQSEVPATARCIVVTAIFRCKVKPFTLFKAENGVGLPSIAQIGSRVKPSKSFSSSSRSATCKKNKVQVQKRDEACTKLHPKKNAKMHQKAKFLCSCRWPSKS